jgi:hypothetical protein
MQDFVWEHRIYPESGANYENPLNLLTFAA